MERFGRRILALAVLLASLAGYADRTLLSREHAGGNRNGAFDGRLRRSFRNQAEASGLKGELGQMGALPKIAISKFG